MKFPHPVCTIQKARPSGTLLFKKSKDLPFETSARTQEIKRSQRDLNPMDGIPVCSIVFRNQKGVFILVRWISHDRWGRNRQGASGSTFFEGEEGSNFVHKSRQIKI